MTRLRAAIFDMDGTLLDSERLYLQAFREAGDVAGAPVTDALFARLIGMDHNRSRAILRAELGTATDAFLAAWDSAGQALMAEPIPVKPTIVALLKALAGVIPMAVATSTRQAEAERRLTMAGLRDHFDTVVGGDAVAQGKPAPDIFVLAARRMGVDPADCAAFEDSENGTRAALSAGMQVVQVPDLIPAQNPDAGQIVAADAMTGARALGLLEGP